MEQVRCVKCGKLKFENAFPPAPNGRRDRRNAICKSCLKEIKDKRTANKSKRSRAGDNMRNWTFEERSALMTGRKSPGSGNKKAQAMVLMRQRTANSYAVAKKTMMGVVEGKIYPIRTNRTGDRFVMIYPINRPYKDFLSFCEDWDVIGVKKYKQMVKKAKEKNGGKKLAFRIKF